MPAPTKYFSVSDLIDRLKFSESNIKWIALVTYDITTEGVQRQTFKKAFTKEAGVYGWKEAEASSTFRVRFDNRVTYLQAKDLIRKRVKKALKTAKIGQFKFEVVLSINEAGLTDKFDESTL